MGSSSSKFKKYLQHGDEFAAMQVTPHFIQATRVYSLEDHSCTCKPPIQLYVVVFIYHSAETVPLIQIMCFGLLPHTVCFAQLLYYKTLCLVLNSQL